MHAAQCSGRRVPPHSGHGQRCAAPLAGGGSSGGGLRPLRRGIGQAYPVPDPAIAASTWSDLEREGWGRSQAARNSQVRRDRSVTGLTCPHV